MSWVRLSDNYIDHPKFVALSHRAFRLWHEGLAYARRHQTDGLIPFSIVRSLRHFTKGSEKELATPYIPTAAPLWELIPATGYKIHDYLDWNLSKEEENQQRLEAKNRVALSRDTELRNALRRRDGEHCRYCAEPVSWTDRRGPKGATYDHVVPGLDNTMDNLVVACRSCNSKKGGRTPEQAGMSLLPPKADAVTRSDLSRIQNEPKSDLGSSGYGSGLGPGLVSSSEKGSGEKPIDARSGRPIFKGQRLVVFEWMLDDCLQILGEHADTFDLHDWFFVLDVLATKQGLVIPKRDGGAWLQAQLVAEAQKRGIPLRMATAAPVVNKRVSGLLAGGEAFLNRGRE